MYSPVFPLSASIRRPRAPTVPSVRQGWPISSNPFFRTMLELEGQLFLLQLLLNGRPMRSIKKQIGRAPITSLGGEEKRAHLAVDHLFGELDQKLTPTSPNVRG